MGKIELELDAMVLAQAWNNIRSMLPLRHHVLLSGPWSDGHLLINVIDGSRTPSKSYISVRADDLGSGFRLVADQLASREAAVAVKMNGTNPTTKTAKARKGRIEEPLSAPSSARAEAPGFTRDRDLVAHLVYKNGRVTQFELRHQFGIKNPAQAINDAEQHFGFTMQTGDALPNGDVPYALTGKSPAIDGMIPMFSEGVEDPDERLYVLELDLYTCESCGRHPVYRVSRTERAYAGICPRHGNAAFQRI